MSREETLSNLIKINEFKYLSNQSRQNLKSNCNQIKNWMNLLNKK